MSQAKNKLYKFCKGNAFFYKIYKVISYCKWKVFYWNHLVIPINKYKRTHKNPVFLIFTPSHTNLGDHAIAWAEQILLSQIGVDYYEITGDQLYPLASYGYIEILNGTKIFINGGGNFGNLWPEIERMNRIIVQNNPNSMICFLPNSICYSEDAQGVQEMEISKKIYNNHNKLFIYAREELSYSIMQQQYKNVRLAPDMVLSMDYSTPYPEVRTGCILCLRNDVEKLLTVDDTEQITQIVHGIFGRNTVFSSTLADGPVSVDRRQEEVRKKLDEYKKAELVITDRLHGMIFAAITGTNCIVLNSRSRKIRGCYKWIDSLGYIRYAENVDDILNQYQKMPTYPHLYDNREIMRMINQLKCDLHELISL